MPEARACQPTAVSAAHRDRDLRDRVRVGNGARIFRLRLGADLHAAGEQPRRAAAGRGTAADHRFRRRAPLVPNAWKQADRKATAVMVARRAGRRAHRNLVPQPARSGDDALDHFRLRVRAACCCCCRAGATAARTMRRSRSGIGGLSGFCSGLAQTGGPPIVGYWLGRPIASVIARANILLFFGASDFFSARQLCADRTDHRRRDPIFACWSVRSMASASGSAPRLFGRASETDFPRHLLRPDRGGGDHRPAGAGRRAALDLYAAAANVLRLASRWILESALSNKHIERHLQHVRDESKCCRRTRASAVFDI